MAADLRPEPRRSSECRPPWPETATPGDLREEEVKRGEKSEVVRVEREGKAVYIFFSGIHI